MPRRSRSKSPPLKKPESKNPSKKRVSASPSSSSSSSSSSSPSHSPRGKRRRSPPNGEKKLVSQTKVKVEESQKPRARENDSGRRDNKKISSRSREREEKGSVRRDRRKESRSRSPKKEKREEQRGKSRENTGKSRENGGKNKETAKERSRDERKDNREGNHERRGREDERRGREEERGGREGDRRGREGERGAKEEERGVKRESHRPSKVSNSPLTLGGRRWDDDSVKKESEAGGWGGDKDKENSSSKPAVEKLKPDFSTSGALEEERHTVNGINLNYSEPPDARPPDAKWRLYVFKGDKQLDPLAIHRQSAYIVGRERKVAHIPIDHPSCSKQHSVIQFRIKRITQATADEEAVTAIRPYIIDLKSTNGTILNGEKIDPAKYYELLEEDVLKFGHSTREYVLLKAEEQAGPTTLD